MKPAFRVRSTEMNQRERVPEFVRVRQHESERKDDHGVEGSVGLADRVSATRLHDQERGEPGDRDRHRDDGSGPGEERAQERPVPPAHVPIGA